MTDTVTLEREYASPPDDVFEAWVNVDLLSRWFGCGPDMLWTIHEWDPRVGGRLRVSMEADHGLIEVGGEFLVVDRPRRLEYRWDTDHVVSVTFAAAGAGTRLRLEHRGLPADLVDTIDGGWTNSLSQLAGALHNVRA